MTVKILIVDDEPDLEIVIRQKFRKQIREGQYEFLFAHDGVEALAMLKEDPRILLVLSDINMPNMDGLTLVGKIKAESPLVQSVIVSAYGDMDNIRTAMNKGAFDFLTKPINFEDFEITLAKTLRQVEAMVEAARDRDQLASINRELEIARTMQQSILPRVFPPFRNLESIDIRAVMHPARNVGGDFFDFFVIDENRMGVVIGDVSGKGVPAAFFMAIGCTLLKAIAIHGGAPGVCLQEVNRILCRDTAGDLFVTLFYAIVHARTGEVHYSIAGHNPPYVLSRGQAPRQLELTGDTVVGMIDDLTFQTRSMQLAPGDALVLYTDGVTEAMDPARNQFGEERLEAFLQRHTDAPTATIIEGMVEAVKSFAGEAPQSDDLTALALRFTTGSRTKG